MIDQGADLRFDDLAGWRQDDAAAAFACFRRSAEAMVEGRPALRQGRAPDTGLLSAARAALDCEAGFSEAEARAFFDRHFRPVRIAAPAFFTGYYEPEVEGVLEPGDGFSAPILGRPADLKTFGPTEARPVGFEHLMAARAAPDGTLHPYPPRAAIEREAMQGHRRVVAWLRDWVEVFLIQVQGSARLRLPDGRCVRLTYAGRNGHPYTSIGRALIEAGEIAPDAMSLERLKSWLRAKGQAEGEPGRVLMQRNASYIFFEANADQPGFGPIAGQGIGLTPLRSIAVDRGLWPYGQPFWIDAELPWRGPTPSPLRRLMIAQDVGSAIVGEARADLFFGSGEQAGALAGGIRHCGTMIALLPRGEAETGR